MLAFQGDVRVPAVVDAHPVLFAHLYPRHLLAVGGAVEIIQIQAADVVDTFRPGMGVVGQQGMQQVLQLAVLGAGEQELQFIAESRTHQLTSPRSTPG